MKITQGDIERLGLKARAIRREIARRLEAEVEDEVVRELLLRQAGAANIFSIKEVLYNIIRYGTVEIPAGIIGRVDRKKVEDIINSI